MNLCSFDANFVRKAIWQKKVPQVGVLLFAKETPEGSLQQTGGHHERVGILLIFVKLIINNSKNY